MAQESVGIINDLSQPLTEAIPCTVRLDVGVVSVSQPLQVDRPVVLRVVIDVVYVPPVTTPLSWTR